MGPSESWLEHGVRFKCGISFCLFAGTLGYVSVCELKNNLLIVTRVQCEFFGDCCFSYMRNSENDIDW